MKKTNIGTTTSYWGTACPRQSSSSTFQGCFCKELFFLPLAGKCVKSVSSLTKRRLASEEFRDVCLLGHIAWRKDDAAYSDAAYANESKHGRGRSLYSIVLADEKKYHQWKSSSTFTIFPINFGGKEVEKSLHHLSKLRWIDVQIGLMMDDYIAKDESVLGRKKKMKHSIP